MRPRTNFVLALHGECLHSNNYKNAFIFFEKHFLVSGYHPDLLHLCDHTCVILCLYIITYLTFIKPIKTGIQKGLHMGDFDTILA